MEKIKFFILALILIHVSASANESGKEPKKIIIYKKKTSVDFSDAVIEGQVENPEGIYVVRPPDKEFGSLLRLRPNFHKEMVRDSLLLK